MVNRTMHARTIGCMAVAASLTLGGCSSALKEPEVRLDRISVGAIGFDGGTLRVRLNVLNPNSFGLQAGGLAYVIEVSEDAANEAAWDTLAVGNFTQRITVEADDSAFVEIPVRFRYRDLGTALTSLLSSGSFDYRVSGSVDLREPMRRQLPFRKSGTIDDLFN